ncbi:serine protease [Rhizophlyctis rosea]|nr:serine protease [Rhizophlyctis rosea]
MLLPDMTGLAVPDKYIVVFKEGVTDAQIASHHNFLSTSVLSTSVPQFRIQGADRDNDEEPAFRTQMVGGDTYGVHKVYDFADFKGYAAKLPKEAIDELKDQPIVDFIEEDRIVSILDESHNPEQKNPPSWGLQRISTRDLPLSKTYTYPASAGEGVNVYVIDTGIHIAHPEFEGRAKIGKTVVKDNDKDGNGHGTHVAGTIGSRSYGVAKKATLIAVKVLDSRGYGDTSGVIEGIEFVATEGPKSAKGGKKAVANMSLGGPASKALDRAVQGAIKAGVVFAVAAGNSGRDACKLSPAGVKEAITVAASDKNDRIASFSEKGECVDVIAPGVDITSTWNDGKINTISGTSMASPHVAGVVALAVAEGNFTTVEEIHDYIKAVASKDRVKGSLGKTPNSLLYNNVVGGKRPDDEPVEPTPGEDEPDEPGNGECPFPQCLFDPSCTGCCTNCFAAKGKKH